ncbi:hypothetical protein BJ165DRAFT_1521447 [Panaeolus papilionaceus]|nr:hypothetical protein BJ165DRAFT_1521447 [Panaeolus papilionaceus]
MPKPKQATPQQGRAHGDQLLREQLQKMPVTSGIAIAYIVSGLRNTKHPTACAGTLLYCLLQISMQPDFQDLIQLSKIHGLWFSIYDFIIAERTDNEFRAMLQKLSTCQCVMNPNSKVFHSGLTDLRTMWAELGVHEGRSETCKFVTTACKLLQAIMGASKEKSVLRGVSNRWPPKASELLPHGPDITMKSLLQWERLVDDCIVTELFTSLIRFVGPQLYKSIVQVDAVRVLLIDPVWRHLSRTLDDMKSESTARTPAAPTYELQDMGTGLINCLHEIFRPPISSNVRCLYGSETKALQLCSLILYLLPVLSRYLDREGLQNFKWRFVAFGQLIFRTFQMERAGKPKIPLHPLIVQRDLHTYQASQVARMQMDRGDSQRPTNEAIAITMTECHISKPCAAPGCFLSFRDQGTSFKTCVRCQTIGYCSKECQKRHWSATEHPHKRYCKILGKIADKKQDWNLSMPGPERLDVGSRWQELRLRDRVVDDFAGVISRMRSEDALSDEEVNVMLQWSAATMTGINQWTDQKVEWHPGFDDYDEIVGKIGTYIGPKPAYVDRTIPWAETLTHKVSSF